MKNLVSIFAGHDASVSFYHAEKDKYYCIEIERLVQQRYFRLHEDNSPHYQKYILEQCRDIAEKEWGIKNDYEAVLICSDGYVQTDPTEIFNTEKVTTIARHHHCHAAAAYFMSPFVGKWARIISYDGGGDDGHFHTYSAREKTAQGTIPYPILHEAYGKVDYGGGYLLCASLVREVAENSRHQLALAGKLMGLCGYGNIIEKYVPAFKEFFNDKNYRKLAETTGLPLKNLDNPWDNPLDNWVFEGQEGYDIAATAQEAFEQAFIDKLNRYVLGTGNIDADLMDDGLILTGGCALNVLVNEKVKSLFPNKPLYVPPNPHDGGLSLGHLFMYKTPTKQVDVTYAGSPLLDRDKLQTYIDQYGATKITKKEIAELIKDGKILGLVYGDSEVGPRALGNRSIVCDPNIADMKDILNSKVKFREWYRPFAPFCKKEEANKYFESRNFDNLEYMSYAPLVKKEYREKLPSITHADNTARLQTVTEDSHPIFYEILTHFGEISETNVLLNTSFNIRGYPILSTIEDALYALNNTEMDYVVIEDYLFSKKVK